MSGGGSGGGDCPPPPPLSYRGEREREQELVWWRQARAGGRARRGGCRQCARAGGRARIALFVPVFSENGIKRRGYWRGRSLTSAWSKDGVAVVVAVSSAAPAGAAAVTIPLTLPFLPGASVSESGGEREQVVSARAHSSGRCTRRGYWRGRSLTSAWSKAGASVNAASRIHEFMTALRCFTEMIPEPVAEFLNCECNMTVLL